jgi:hypothetical protein
MLDKSKDKLVPSYQVNTMLLNSPSFNTPHLSEYVIMLNLSYNVNNNMKFIFLYYQIFLLLGYNCLQ